MNRTTFIVSLIVLVLGIVVLAVLLTGLIAGRWLIVPIDIKSTDIDKNKYQLFVDLLTVLLTIMAVGLGAFGLGAYRLLDNAIRRDTMNAVVTELEAERALERLTHARLVLDLALNMGYNKWFEWSVTSKQDRKGRKRVLLDMAIDISRKALKYVEEIKPKDFAKLKEKKHDDEIIQQIENQLKAVKARELPLKTT